MGLVTFSVTWPYRSFMNVFTRENTNDGVGWWVRFSHYIQTGEYGYPSLYTNFPEDMLPALGEYGSGSGTGCLYLQEPNWPQNKAAQPLMADWGKSKVFIHCLTPDGASFTNELESFFAQLKWLTPTSMAQAECMAAWAGEAIVAIPRKVMWIALSQKDGPTSLFPNCPNSPTLI